MKILRTATTAVALSLAGIAFGGVGLASADDSTAAQSSTTGTRAGAMPGPGMGPGPGGAGGLGGPTEMAADLADALGLEESDVLASMQTVHHQLAPEAAAPGETPTPRTQAEHEARLTEMTSALADELGVSEQMLTNAMD